MNLIWFLLIGIFLSLLVGEFGRFPFGSPIGIRLTDILVGLTVTFLAVWQIGINHRINIPRVLLWLFGFWAVSLVSIGLSGQFGGLIYLFRFILYSSLCWVSYALIKDQIIRYQTLLKLVVVIGLGLAVIGIVQLIIFPDFYYLTDFGYDPHQFRLAATFLDPNYLGCWLVISLLCSWECYRLKHRRRYLSIALVLGLAIILTFSRSAYLMAAVSALFYLGRYYRRGLISLALISVVLYATVPKINQRIEGALVIDRSASQRLMSWQRGLAAFQDNPVSGVGFGNLRQYYIDHNLLPTYTPDGGNGGAGVDSSLIYLLAMTGVVGTTIFILIWIVYFANIRKSKWHYLMLMILIGLIVDSQFINAMFYPPIMVVWYTLVGGSEA